MEAREVLAPVGPKSPTLAQLILGVHRSPLYDERFTADSTFGYGTFYIGHNPVFKPLEIDVDIRMHHHCTFLVIHSDKILYGDLKGWHGQIAEDEQVLIPLKEY